MNLNPAQMKILAFGHKSRTGKDTATKLLIEYINNEYPNLVVKRRAFADTVKEVSYQCYKSQGLQPRSYYDIHPEARSIKLPRLNMDPVEIWVAIGNKIREIYPETWVDIALDCSADIVIISDLRYTNEVNRIHQLGGKCVKIERADAIIRNTVADNALNNYQGWDGIIQNNTNKEDFKATLIALIDGFDWPSTAIVEER